MGLRTYQNVIRKNESPRQIERRVFAKITSEVEKFSQDYDACEYASDRFDVLASGLKDALQKNLDLWNAIRFDLMSEGNLLSDDLKARLISLSIFVEEQTVKILRGEDRKFIYPLVSVNQSILRGLSGYQPVDMEVA
jgi:flagellar protein FlaF